MGRAPCCAKEGVNRGAWTAIEDKLLVEYINQHGEGKWRSISKLAGLKRCGKSCRLRWLNYLRPDIKRGNIEPQEEDLIIRLHRLLGNRWSLIAGRLPGRTDNEIKNYWNTTLSKKQQGAVSSTSAGNIPNPDHQEAEDNKTNKQMKMKTTKPPAIPLPVSHSSSPTPSKAVRTKAIRCTKVIIPIPNNVNNPLSHVQVNNYNHEMIGIAAADPRQDQAIAINSHKYWTSNNEGGDHQFHHEYYGTLSAATTSGELEYNGGEDEEHQLLDFENFLSDFHEVVEGDQMGIASGSTAAADTDFWSILNDWVVMEDGDDNIINNTNVGNNQGEGYQLLR